MQRIARLAAAVQDGLDEWLIPIDFSSCSSCGQSREEQSRAEAGEDEKARQVVARPYYFLILPCVSYITKERINSILSSKKRLFDVHAHTYMTD